MSQIDEIISIWSKALVEIDKTVDTPRSWLVDSETIREWSEDGSRYCKHGTDVGHPWGRDILCHYCEDGFTDTEFNQMMEIRMLRDQLKQQRTLMIDTVATLIDRMQVQCAYHIGDQFV